MGAYSPAPIVDDAMVARVMEEIIRPTVRGMAAEGNPFTGVLFAGLMISDKGPKTLEFNVRFGDPECQVLMSRLKSDLLPALIAAADGQLKQFDLRWHDDPAIVVVMAAKGYPGSYQKGTVIKGLDDAGEVEGVTVFHAGTAMKDGNVVATGGRVLGVSAVGKNVGEAQARAYQAVDKINWPEGFCRRDIGWRAVAREKQRG
jgi:phosphoribosylamine--glycine ligase